MAKEIERKYLVVSDSYKKLASDAVEIKQGYISREPGHTVRVRIKGTLAFMTVKGVTTGCVRDEWEFPLPVSDAREMLARVCQGRLIEKVRYVVPFAGLKWEVDEFAGPLSPLVVAEVELPSADYDLGGKIPGFVGREVTGDPRYYNSALASDSVVTPPVE